MYEVQAALRAPDTQETAIEGASEDGPVEVLQLPVEGGESVVTQPEPPVTLVTFERPPAALVELFARATWPEDADRAVAVLTCESGKGQHEKTYSLDAQSAGPMQLHRSSWETFFLRKYGWTWEDVIGVGDKGLAIHFAAAREVYDRAGSWSPWTCARILGFVKL